MQRLDAVAGLAAQQGLDLLRDDGPAEHAGESVVDRRLEFALDPRNQPRWLLMFYRSPALALRYCRCAANESPGCWFTPAWYRDSTTPRHFRNRENRIHAVQRRARGVGHNGRRATAPLRRFGNRAITVVWSIGCFPGEWRNGRRAGFRCQCPSGRGVQVPFAHTERFDEGHGLERGRDLSVLRIGGAGVRAASRHIWRRMSSRWCWTSCAVCTATQRSDLSAVTG